MLADFLDRPDEMRAAAQRIREGVRAGEFDGLPDLDSVESDDEGAFEGRLLLLRHKARERDPKLRRRKIEKVLAEHGKLECEVCSFDFERTYGDRGHRFAEVHHVVPLHVSNATTTRLADLAVLCANCHRMIHRKRWITPDELRALVRARLELS
ncbi:HNH endonuclease [Actinokineospora fastidiosa]|uniref:HNH domain-containing protein n=1 Tax=Actinokineospora fastidiosa TaxID=1816 RepID=A0A918GTU6_9PSEU|nr:HNH endonuclease [Actinokineospora fastidiosa]GGS60191.1 hypothetical protein GCM10010171_63930 [Actinokineospora fastidiosa]